MENKLKITHKRRVIRARATIHGTASRPRLSVKRTNEHIEGQVIDDTVGKTLCAIHDREMKTEKLPKDMSKKVGIAYLTGKHLAEKAKKAGISKVIFDRRGAQYHGRIAAFAKGAREGGLLF